MGGKEAAQGAGILKHVFGQKTVGVEKAIGSSFGVDQKGVGNVMTMLAPLVMGALGKETKQKGLDASALTSMLTEERSQLAKQEPQGMHMLGAMYGITDRITAGVARRDRSGGDPGPHRVRPEAGNDGDGAGDCRHGRGQALAAKGRDDFSVGVGFPAA